MFKKTYIFSLTVLSEQIKKEQSWTITGYCEKNV